MKTLGMILAIACLTACHESTSGSSNPQTETPAIETPAIETPVDQPPANDNVVDNPSVGSIAVSVTYYAKSFTEAPINGWINKTYTSEGYCLTYRAKDYCWDDGVHTIDFTVNNFRYGPSTYTYWGMKQGMHICHGDCNPDAMTEPMEVDQYLKGNLGNSKVDAVFSSGTASTVTCQDDGPTLDCGSFKVTL